MASSTTLRSIARTASRFSDSSATAMHASAVRSSLSMSVITAETPTSSPNPHQQQPTRKFSSPVTYHTSKNNQDLATILLLLSPSPPPNSHPRTRKPSSSRNLDCEDSSISETSREGTSPQHNYCADEIQDASHQGEEDQPLRLKKKTVSQVLS